ncbi:MAG: ATP-grasp domain-containing protein, partial [Pseudanabaena sp.]
SQEIRVWVTGILGDLGQAVLKALRLSSRCIQFYGSDMSNRGTGHAFVENFYTLPHANDSNYLSCLNDFCQEFNISVVIPASEPEIYILSRLGDPPQLPCGVPILCQNHSFIDRYGDKLKCMEALSEEIELAPFADGQNLDLVNQMISEYGFPVVVKERKSSGSRSIKKVSNYKDLDQALNSTSLPIVQSYIDDTFGEFSIGAFSTQDLTRCISFKRELGLVGCSWFAEFNDDIDVLNYADKIVKSVHPLGSINIQVRKSIYGVKLLEINPRISSLVAARSLSGFHDLAWSLDMILGGITYLDTPTIYPIRYQRFFADLVDYGNGFGRVSSWDCPESKK